MDKVQGNKLIAAFVGIEIEYPQINHPLDPVEYDMMINAPDWISNHDLQYIYENHDSAPNDVFSFMKFDSSWDWVMPTWDLFRTNVWLHQLQSCEEYQQTKNYIERAFYNVDIKDAFKQLLFGIIWYNQQNKYDERFPVGDKPTGH